eukprot:4696359-Amphidinium_carterae.1
MDMKPTTQGGWQTLKKTYRMFELGCWRLRIVCQRECAQRLEPKAHTHTRPVQILNERRSLVLTVGECPAT